MSQTIAENLDRVKAEITKACETCGRNPNSVRLIAVSKKQPDALLYAAYAAGQRDFGENYVQELVRKKQLLPADVRWHLIGHLQSNKAKQALMAASWLHTVDSTRLVAAIVKQGVAEIPQLLLEVNIAAEASKSGLDPQNVPALLEIMLDAKLPVRGLMCIPPQETSNLWFVKLRELRDALEARFSCVLPELSMGMSADYGAAILAGATWVRVGTAIFGERA